MSPNENMTVLEFVRQYFPNATEKEADFILWELTGFPLANLDELRSQLQHIKEVGIRQAIVEKQRLLAGFDQAE